MAEEERADAAAPAVEEEQQPQEAPPPSDTPAEEAPSAQDAAADVESQSPKSSREAQTAKAAAARAASAPVAGASAQATQAAEDEDGLKDAVEKMYSSLRAQVAAELRNTVAGVRPPKNTKKGGKKKGKGSQKPSSPEALGAGSQSASALRLPAIKGAKGKGKNKAPGRRPFDPPKFAQIKIPKGTGIEVDAARTEALLSGWGDPSAISVPDEITGETALHLAAAKGRLPLLNLLLMKHAEVEALDAAGRTPLYAAACNGHTECCVELLTMGAKPDTPNKFGNTPLHAVARNGHTEVAEMLISLGADPAFENMQHKTAYDRCCNSELCEFMRAIKAETDSRKEKRVASGKPEYETIAEYQSRILKRDAFDGAGAKLQQLSTTIASAAAAYAPVRSDTPSSDHSAERKDALTALHTHFNALLSTYIKEDKSEAEVDAAIGAVCASVERVLRHGLAVTSADVPGPLCAALEHALGRPAPDAVCRLPLEDGPADEPRARGFLLFAEIPADSPMRNPAFSARDISLSGSSPDFTGFLAMLPVLRDAFDGAGAKLQQLSTTIASAAAAYAPVRSDTPSSDHSAERKDALTALHTHFNALLSTYIKEDKSEAEVDAAIGAVCASVERVLRHGLAVTSADVPGPLCAALEHALGRPAPDAVCRLPLEDGPADEPRARAWLRLMASEGALGSCLRAASRESRQLYAPWALLADPDCACAAAGVLSPLDDGSVKLPAPRPPRTPQAASQSPASAASRARRFGGGGDCLEASPSATECMSLGTRADVGAGSSPAPEAAGPAKKARAQAQPGACVSAGRRGRQELSALNETLMFGSSEAAAAFRVYPATKDAAGTGASLTSESRSDAADSACATVGDCGSTMSGDTTTATHSPPPLAAAAAAAAAQRECCLPGLRRGDVVRTGVASAMRDRSPQGSSSMMGSSEQQSQSQSQQALGQTASASDHDHARPAAM
eukprot:m51a1_g11756 hypothetical protein (961) ;mRNA; r:202717-206299